MYKKLLAMLLGALVLMSAGACNVKNTNLSNEAVVATTDEATFDEVTLPDEIKALSTVNASTTSPENTEASTEKLTVSNKSEITPADISSGGNISENDVNESYNDYGYNYDYSDSYVSTDIKSLLNSASLNPMKTNHSELDGMVDNIFAQIHTSGMSTYDKVKACYDYLVNNLTYEVQVVWMVNDPCYKSYLDRTIVSFANTTLSTKGGVCDQYTMCFVVMCRRIGLEAYPAGGKVAAKAGGYTGHTWAYIVLNGTNYVFDPQVQSNNMDASYYYFGKTYSQLGSMYQWDNGARYNAADFCNFEVEPIFDFSLSETAIGLAPGQTFKLEALGLPEGTEIFWTSGDEDVATVDSNGVVTAVGDGIIHIGADARVGTRTYGETCYVEVVEKDYIFCIGETRTMALGAYDDFDYCVEWNPYKYPVGVEDYSIDIVSDNPDIIKVSNGMFFAVGEGEATVTATLNGPNGICEKASIDITVIEGIEGGVTNKVWPGWH